LGVANAGDGKTVKRRKGKKEDGRPQVVRKKQKREWGRANMDY
jgi:hypothetical protein